MILNRWNFATDDSIWNKKLHQTKSAWREK